MNASELATPTLMRGARGVYARSIRAQLHAAGFGDLPRNGAVILAGIEAADGPRQDLPFDLGVTKQAVSQAIDVLVDRGYVTRRADPEDRRRITLELTERGRQVTEAVQRGVEAVDARLRERATGEQIEAMRSALAALAAIKMDDTEAGTARRRAAAQLRRFAPIFPVRDVAAALAHYAALGFGTSSYDEGYGFASRDGVELHLSLHDEHEHGHEHGHGPHGGGAYLFVRDAGALYEEWSRAGVGGQTHPPAVMPWGLREGAHTDPDGNLIRFGSFVSE